MIRIGSEPPRIKALSSGHYLKLHYHIVRHLQPAYIGCLNIILLNIHVLHIIQVYRLWHIKFHPLDKQCCVVQGYIYTAKESERLGSVWHKTEFNAPLSLNIDGIGKIILIKVCADIRKRTHKAILHYRHIVGKDIYLAKHILGKHLHALFVEYFINSTPMLPLHYLLLRTRTLAIYNL